MADPPSATGKYALLSVPDFDKDTVGPRKGQTMTSFLRLGAFHDTPELEEATKRSLALAELALAVSTSQGGHLTEPYGAEVNTDDVGIQVFKTDADGNPIKDADGNPIVEKQRWVFLDDQRNYDPDCDPPIADRQEQSNALLDRGGWWEHSDGNRVSTTWGDRIDVVRGNYKMVIMSRQDDPGGGGGWDVSGGNMQDLGPNMMPGASVRCEFRKGMFGQQDPSKDPNSAGGTWHLENTTNNFIQTSDYAGDFFEHWYGDHKECTIGSETPKQFDGKPKGNPHILEKTWASKIESYTGSASCWVPEVHETSYVTAASAESHVGSSTELTIAGATAATTIVGTTAELTIAGAVGEAEIVGVKAALSVVGFTGEITIGTKLAGTLGASHEWVIGPHEETKIPDKKEVALAKLTADLKKTEVCMLSNKVDSYYQHMALMMDLKSMLVAIGM